MKADDPRHGTYAGALAHQRSGVPQCEPCTRARRREQSRWANLRRLGYDHYRDAAPVQAHIEELIDGGMNYVSIAELAGLSPTTIEDVGRVFDRVHYTTAEAILGVPLIPQPDGLLPAIGARRRLQALAVLGWSQTAIADEARRLGVPVTISGIRYIMRGLDDRVRVRNHDAVATLYDELSMTLPPQGRAASLARAVARREKYAPPLAWDNIDTDEKPRGIRSGGDNELDPVVVERILAGDWRLASTPAEKSAVCARWVANGGTLGQLERLTGWNAARYYKTREAA